MFHIDKIKTDNFFIFVGLINTYEDVIKHLEEHDYKEFVDYWYPHREILLDGSVDYTDLYGNEYEGCGYSLKIKLRNCGKLYIKQNCTVNNICITVYDEAKIIMNEDIQIRDQSKIHCESESKIFLGRKLNFPCLLKIKSGKNSQITIDENFEIEPFFTQIDFVNISAMFNSTIHTEKDISSGASLQIIAFQNSNISICKDCMFSREIIIRAGSAHTIFDIDGQKNLSAIGRKISIGKHVWLGHRAIIHSGAEIGAGSIVGINTYINKKFPTNCSIAGNPARIIKNNVAWRRETDPNLNNYDDFSQFDFRDR